MKAFLAIPITILLIVGSGIALGGLLGWNAPRREMAVAAGFSLAACTLAMAPVLIAARASPAVLGLAALASTMLHLIGHVGAIAVLVFTRIPLGTAAVWWLMAFYWISLIVLTVCLTRIMKRSPAIAQDH